MRPRALLNSVEVLACASWVGRTVFGPLSFCWHSSRVHFFQNSEWTYCSSWTNQWLKCKDLWSSWCLICAYSLSSNGIDFSGSSCPWTDSSTHLDFMDSENSAARLLRSSRVFEMHQALKTLAIVITRRSIGILFWIVTNTWSGRTLSLSFHLDFWTESCVRWQFDCYWNVYFDFLDSIY